MLEELQCWDIIDKIFSIKIDNVSNNDAVDTFLKEKKIMFTFKRYIIFKYDLAKNKKTLFQVFCFFGLIYVVVQRFLI